MTDGVRLRVLLEPRHGGTYRQILALARATEDAGLDAFFRSDHYLGVDPDDEGYLPSDSWTTLAGLARDTRRVRLGTLVTAATFRHPGVLAVTTAGVDSMSEGRVELGLGAGWYGREHAAFGLDFPGTGERFDRLEEQLAVITGIWRASPSAPFEHIGAHYRVERCVTAPATVQPGGPPIIIGGSGRTRTPELAARYAAEFNVTFPVGLAERLVNFERACERVGRDPGSVRRSVIVPVACGSAAADVQRRVAAIGNPMMLEQAITGSPEEVAAGLRGLLASGIDTIYLHLYDVQDIEHVLQIGQDVLPVLRASGPMSPLRLDS